MAKQIIVIEVVPDDGRNVIRYVAWFGPYPVNRRVPRPDVSASFYSGATAAEIDQIKSGEIVEEVRDIRLPASYTATEVRIAVLKDYQDRAAWLAAQPFRLQYFGTYFDSVTGWN